MFACPCPTFVAIGCFQLFQRVIRQSNRLVQVYFNLIFMEFYYLQRFLELLRNYEMQFVCRLLYQMMKGIVIARFTLTNYVMLLLNVYVYQLLNEEQLHFNFILLHRFMIRGVDNKLLCHRLYQKDQNLQKLKQLRLYFLVVIALVRHVVSAVIKVVVFSPIIESPVLLIPQAILIRYLNQIMGGGSYTQSHWIVLRAKPRLRG